MLSAPEAPPPPPKRRLFRDLLVFQVKLLLDGARDLLLSPLSFIAALSDLISGNRGADSNFYSLLRAGKRTDKWIDLFGAAKRTDPDAAESELDRALDKLEVEIAASYRDGKINSAASDALQRAKALLGAVPTERKPSKAQEAAPEGESDDKP